MISAKIIEDSVHDGCRLTTLELEYPRYIHSELMTHRVFSRNAQSSRAIPVDKVIEKVEKDEWYPYFMKNKPGMAASEPLEGQDLIEAKGLWNQAKREAVRKAKQLSSLSIHKQTVNRLLEPFSTIKVILSSTEFDNFFSLRIHPAAQQEIQVLATKIRDAITDSIPARLDVGEWHLPYIREDERVLPTDLLVKISTARCARVSYLNHDGFRDIDKDLSLHNSLVKEGHMSPTEHVATPGISDKFYGNFRGWIQYRKHIEYGWKLK